MLSVISFVSYSVLSQKYKNKTKIAIRECTIAIKGLNVCFIRRMWKTLQHGARKPVEHDKYGLMGQSSKILEDCSDDSNGYYRGCVQDVSSGNDISNWARDHSCNVWKRIWLVFSPQIVLRYVLS